MYDVKLWAITVDGWNDMNKQLFEQAFCGKSQPNSTVAAHFTSPGQSGNKCYWFCIFFAGKAEFGGPVSTFVIYIHNKYIVACSNNFGSFSKKILIIPSCLDSYIQQPSKRKEKKSAAWNKGSWPNFADSQRSWFLHGRSHPHPKPLPLRMVATAQWRATWKTWEDEAEANAETPACRK